MSAVVDSSVLVAALVDGGQDGLWAEAILADGPLHLPELSCADATNILRRLERAGEISTRQANAARADLMRLDLILYPFAPFADRVWQLRHNVTSYDAWYVALAEALVLPLATLDGRLSRANGIKCAFLLPGGR